MMTSREAAVGIFGLVSSEPRQGFRMESSLSSVLSWIRLFMAKVSLIVVVGMLLLLLHCVQSSQRVVSLQKVEFNQEIY